MKSFISKKIKEISMLLGLLFFFSSNGVVFASDVFAECGGSFEFFLEKAKKHAQKKGVSEKAISEALKFTKFNKKIIEMDRRQKSFKMSFMDFSGRAINKYRLVNGRKNIIKHSNLFEKANNESYHFDLSDKIDVHLIDYEADAVGFLDWHTDFMGPGIRDNSVGEYIKMSLSLGLNDDFEGGQLEFDRQYALPEPTRLNKNDYIIFPAFHRHRVLPVTKGKRVVCVAWAYGPNWK